MTLIIYVLMSNKLHGPFILILSMVFAVIGTTLVRYLSHKYTPESVLFYKSFWSLMTLFYYHQNFNSLITDIQQSAFLPNITRALFGTLGVWLWVQAIQSIPLSDASTLSLTSSFFAALIGYFFLKEKSTIYKNLALFSGFIGAYIIIAPSFSIKNIYYIYPVGSAFCFGMSGVLARYLALKNQEKVTSFYLFSTMLLFSLASFHVAFPQNMQDFGILAFIGITYGLSQLMYVRAYAYEEASYLANFKFLKVPLHTFMAFLFFQEIPTYTTLTGFLVIISALLLLVYKR
jgi:S-adenosylmethionine uptake transporter